MVTDIVPLPMGQDDGVAFAPSAQPCGGQRSQHSPLNTT